MAGILRSPQFSEESAWLPPWLHSHRPPLAEDGLQSSPSQKMHEENTCQMEASQMVAEWSKHSSFRLFLSEESNLSRGSIPSPENAANLDLHLSSEGISQIPSGLLFSFDETRKNAPSNSPPRNPTVSVEGCQGGAEDNAIQVNSLAGNHSSNQCLLKEKHTGKSSDLENQDSMIVRLRKRKSKGKLKSCIGPSPNVLKTKMQTTKNLRGPQLNEIDVDEAVELCIAASEAVVISELASTNAPSELSSAKSIVEVALQIKQARKQCHFEVQASMPNHIHQSDETDQLSDLDDHDMASAFDDVGMTVTQVISNPTDGGDTSSLRPCDGDRSSGWHLNSDFPDVKGNEKVASVSITGDCLLPRIKDASCKDKNGATLGDKNVMTVAQNVFLAETSTLSETIYSIGESTSVQLKTDPTIAAKMSEDGCGSSCNQNKKSAIMEAIVSQDIVGSSGFSPLDPLCSIVPCSLPLNSSFICMRGTPEMTMKGIEPVSPHFEFPNSLGDIAMQNDKDMVASPSFSKLEEARTSTIQHEISGITFKKVNSLRDYSMVVPKQPNGGANSSAGTVSLETKSLDFLCMNITKNASDDLGLKHSSEDLDKKIGLANIGPGGDGCFDGSQPTPEQSYSNHIVIAAKADSFPAPPKNHERCPSPILQSQSNHHEKTFCTDMTGHRTTSLKVSSTSKPKRKRTANSRIAPCHNGGVMKSCLANRSKTRSVTLKELNAASKRVRFSMPEPNRNQVGRVSCSHGQRNSLNTIMCRKKKVSQQQLVVGKEHNPLKNLATNSGNGPIFYGLEFLVTGFTRRKKIEVENIIRIYGGIVLPTIPRFSNLGPRLCNLGQKMRVQCANQHCQLVISPKKVESIEFLYGCAINTWILNADWILDSVQAGLLLPPEKYAVLSILDSHLKAGCLWSCLGQGDLIFRELCVMLHGSGSFCSKFSLVIKHGGGRVFRSLLSLSQSLNGRTDIGAVVVEDDHFVSRHLKHCALEHNLQTVSVDWIVNSLFSGKLLPLKRDRSSPFHRIKMPTFPAREIDMSEEI